MGNNNRRSVLKSISGIGISTAAIPQVKGSDSDTQYEGVAYDPTTHEIIGIAHGKISHNKGIDGDLIIDGDKFSVNRPKKTYESISRQNIGESVKETQFEKEEENENDYNRPKKIKIKSFGESSLTGVIRYPELDRIAFALERKSNQKRSSVKRLLNEYRADKKHVDSKEFKGGQEIKPTSETQGTCDVDNCTDDDYDLITFNNTQRGWSDHTEEYYKHCVYVTADGSKDHFAQQIPANGWNRWNIQNFYPKIPEIDYSRNDYDKCRGGTCHMLLPGSSRYYFDLSYKSGWQNDDLYSNNPYPSDSHSDGSEFNFGLSISAGYGPISAGFSISMNNNAQSPEFNNSHRDTEWEFPLDSFPTDQRSCRGVYFDINAAKNYGEQEVKVECSSSWSIIEMNGHTGDRTGVYSETDTQEKTITVDIIGDENNNS
ncbi:hypothetical protein [Natrinema gari]|uniref:hypothetical protein n=1 Tax=Natrinema gari TaxID=419186 RepID=UPI000B15CB42|nr:hypothetical protein [Natrinema gari]